MAADGVRVHALRRQLALGDELFDRIDVDGAIHLAEEFGLLLRPIAIADRIDQQVAQRVALEQFAQHVVDLAAERGPRLFKLFEKPAIDFALARVGGAEVPEVTDLGLADAVDAAEPLFQPVRVPRQVVVHHEVRATLKVDAFTGGIVGDHDADDRIAVEGSDRSATGFPRNAAMDHHHRRRIAEARGDLMGQIFERVLRLGEDQDFPTQTRCWVEHDGII